jgi:glycosyltransferase involved in cell wall biosynthesis
MKGFVLNSSPKFSFLICSTGNSRALECIRALQNQSYENFEVIVVFDCNVADMQFDVSLLSSDSRFKIIKNKVNLGLTKSLNIGLRHARGEIIVRQDDDDISHTDRLEKINDVFVFDKNIDIVVSWAKVKYHEEGDHYIHKTPETDFDIKDRLQKKNCLIHSTLAIKKDTLLSVNGYNENFIFAQDYELYLSLIRKRATFYGIQEPLVTRYELPNTITVSRRTRQAIFSLAAIALYVGSSEKSRNELIWPILRVFIPKPLRNFVRMSRLVRNKLI